MRSLSQHHYHSGRFKWTFYNIADNLQNQVRLLRRPKSVNALSDVYNAIKRATLTKRKPKTKR